VASAHLVRRILLRSALFAIPASALWALLPVVAQRLQLDSSGYGVLLGALGVGAVAGVFALPIARTKFSDNVVIAASAVLFGVGSVAAALLPFGGVLPFLVLAGFAWIGTLTVMNASLQLTLPQWVRSRGAAIYILVFMGTMALGSSLWGFVAEALGIALALEISGAALLLVAASVRLLPLLPGTGAIDRTTSLAWPTPTLMWEPDATDGPVLVSFEYSVRPEARDEFARAMVRVRDSRRRTGASRWRLYRSGEHENTVLETFLVSSWGEFRRQQTERLTGRDREMLAAATAHADGPPVERHFFPERTPPAGRTPRGSRAP
jgi:MFS family permease